MTFPYSSVKQFFVSFDAFEFAQDDDSDARFFLKEYNLLHEKSPTAITTCLDMTKQTHVLLAFNGKIQSDRAVT